MHTTCGQRAEIGYNIRVEARVTDTTPENVFKSNLSTHSTFFLFHHMRKIEAQMNSAIRSKTNFSKANTSVTWNDRIASVYLHGNLIAKVGDTFVQVFDGGWQSVTTKSRLNALLSEVTCDGGVFQRDWTWYYNSSKVGTVPFFSGMEAV